MKKILLILFLATTFLNAQQLAFPEAIGHARFAVGGRGGTTYIVTNLNASGAGSFREAVEASGARTVVFDVSGTIDLGGGLGINNPNITILGQTAPGDGIAISNGSLTITTSEVIIRHIRVRLGDGGYKDINGNVVGPNSGDLDTILINSIGNNISNIIIDHCSVSWSIDEVLSSFGGTGLINNVSIINNIISHGLNCSHHGDGCHSMGSLFNYNTKNVSVIGNLYFGNGERHLRLGANVTAEFHNNIVYGFSSGMVVGFGTQVDMANNNFVQGNYSLNFSSRNIIEATSSGATVDGVTYANTDTDYYISGNISNAFYPVDGGSPTAFNTSIGRGYINAASPSRLVSSGYSIVSIAQAEADIIANAGATIPNRDSYDSQLISDLENDVLANLIDTQLQVGGYPTLASGTSITDVNNDGIDDAWFSANVTGGDIATDISNNGYTWLENYAFQLDGSAPIDINATAVTVNPSTLSIQANSSASLSVAFTPINTKNKSGIWSSDNLGVATVSSNGLVSGVSIGTATITFTSNDGSFTDSSVVTVTAELLEAAPVLVSAVLSGNDYILTFELPNNTKTPIGGYDTFINGVDQNDNANYNGFTRTITGLNTTISQTFFLESRYTDTQNFPQSNSITVNPLTEPILKTVTNKKRLILITN